MRPARRAFAAGGSFLDLSTVNNTQLRLFSTALADVDGAGVASFTELSNARHATQATAGRRPIMRRTGDHISPNGSPMVEFDGNDDWLSGVLPGAGEIPVSVTGLMIYCYYKQISLTNSSAFDQQQLFDCGTSGGVLEVVANTSTDNGLGWAADRVGCLTGTATDTFGASQLGYQLLTLEFIPPAGAGASYKAYRNGVQIGVTETNWQMTDIRVGYGFGNVLALNCGARIAMGALQVVSERHDAIYRGQVEASILARYEG